MSTTPSISLTNANNKFSEIAWTYTSLTNSEIKELALIAVSDNNDDSLISKKILSPTLTSLNLIELIDLTLQSNICIEVTDSSGVTYSSNVLTIPKRLLKPTIYNPETSSSSPYKIVTKNKAVDFYVYGVDLSGSAQFFNIILYDSVLSNILELPDISIPTTATTSTTIKNIGVTCSKSVADPTVFQISLTNLENDSIYRIAVYVTNRYSNNAVTPLSNIENESLPSNTVKYVEPTTGPQIPTLKSVSFDISNNPYNYTFEIMPPANSATFNTTEIAVYISTASNFAQFNKVLLDISGVTNPISSSNVLYLSADLTDTIRPGTEYYYKIVVSNSDSTSETIKVQNVDTNVISTSTPKTNVLTIMACSRPLLTSNAYYEVELYDNSFNVTWQSTTPNTTPVKYVDYAGSGEIQSDVTINGTTNPNKTSPYIVSSPIADSSYNVTVAYKVVNIITKITYNGATSIPVTTNTTTTYSTNMNIGNLNPFKYYNTTIQPVIHIEANVLSYNNGFTPIDKAIDLAWTPGVNSGIVPTYRITYSNDSGFATSNTISTQGTPYSKLLTNLVNGNKYYIKIETQYVNAPYAFKYKRDASGNTIRNSTKTSDPVILKDSSGNNIAVAPFNNIAVPTNFTLESSKNSVKASWNSVGNPLGSVGAATLASVSPTIKYGIIVDNNTANITENTNFTFNNLEDGTNPSIKLYAILEGVYEKYYTGINFNNVNPIQVKSTTITGTGTPFDGPDITNVTYDQSANIIKLTIDLNGTSKTDTSLLIMGTVSATGQSASTFSYSSLLNSSNLSVGGASNNEYTLSLSNTTPAIQSSSTVKQYVVITNSTAGISYATYGFPTNYALNADTFNKVISVIN
jgi:hypothetical protein